MEQVHRRKATLKLQPKSKGTKRKTKDADPAIQKSETDRSREDDIRNETEKFIQLDTWRYEDMPATIAKRKVASEEVLLSKEELVRIMEWKLYVPIPFYVPGSDADAGPENTATSAQP